jgi:heme exporter protein A
MTVALAVEQLSCRRAHRVLFSALDLTLAAGDFISLEGPNGAGKTSLLRIIAGFLAPTAGIVRIRTEAGEVTEGEDRTRTIGWLGDKDAVKPQLTAGEQLRFWRALYGSKRALPEGFGLAGLMDMPGQFLSAGQKRRLALARLILSERPVWLLDEPLAALDAAGKALLAEILKAHCAAGGIAIAATHDPIGVGGLTLRLGAP